MPRTVDSKLQARRRSQIIAAAKRCFAEHGFHQSRMREVIEEAGLSTGAVYNYFPGKAEIVKAIIEEEGHDIDFLIKRLRRSEDPCTGLAELAGDVVMSMNGERARLAMEISAEVSRKIEVKSVVQSNDRRLLKGITQTVRDGQKKDLISDSQPASSMAQSVMAIYEGFIGRLGAGYDLKPKSAAKMARLSVLKLLAPES